MSDRPQIVGSDRAQERYFVFVCDKPEGPSQPMEVGFERNEYDKCPCGEKLRAVEVVAVDGLPDPGKLRLLADWIDAKFPDDGDPEVQGDLRRWADNLEGRVD